MAFHRLTSSTPLSLKLNEKSSRKRWFEDDKGQPLFGKTLLEYKDDDDCANAWDDIEGPGYFDFDKPSPEIMPDKFFDLKEESDNPSPLKKEEMVLPTNEDLINLTDSLSACSISMIDNEIANETMFTDDSSMNTTVIDRTRHSLGPMMMKKNETSSCQRRLSTIPSPFSFESREVSKHQRKQAREAFKAAMEKEQRPIFKARPAPKMKPRPPLVKIPKVTNTINNKNNTDKPLNGQAKDDNSSKENRPLDQPKAGPRQKSYVIASKINAKIEKPVPSVNPTNKIRVSVAKDNIEMRKSTNLSKIPTPTIKNEFLTPKIPVKINKNTQTILTSIQQKNQRPIGRQKSSTTKPKSPNLLTAKRAKQRQLLEVQARQRELEREQCKINKIKEEQKRLKEESDRLRKLTVHKPLPLPKFINNQMTKRQLSNPTIPLDVKRRRIV